MHGNNKKTAICNSHQPTLNQKLQKSMSFPTLLAGTKIKYENTTMYKNNSGLIAKTKASKYNKDLCLTEKFAV